MVGPKDDTTQTPRKAEFCRETSAHVPLFLRVEYDPPKETKQKTSIKTSVTKGLPGIKLFQKQTTHPLKCWKMKCPFFCVGNFGLFSEALAVTSQATSISHLGKLVKSSPQRGFSGTVRDLLP